jgi:hypothetical protein
MATKENKLFQSQFDKVLFCDASQREEQHCVISQNDLLKNQSFSLSLALRNACLAGLEDSKIATMLPYYIPKLRVNSSELFSNQKYKKLSGISNALTKITNTYQQSPGSVSLWSSNWESQHADFLAQEIAEALKVIVNSKITYEYVLCDVFRSIMAHDL